MTASEMSPIPPIYGRNRRRPTTASRNHDRPFINEVAHGPSLNDFHGFRTRHQSPCSASRIGPERHTAGPEPFGPICCQHVSDRFGRAGERRIITTHDGLRHDRQNRLVDACQ